MLSITSRLDRCLRLCLWVFRSNRPQRLWRRSELRHHRGGEIAQVIPTVVFHRRRRCNNRSNSRCTMEDRVVESSSTEEAEEERRRRREAEDTRGKRKEKRKREEQMRREEKRTERKEQDTLRCRWRCQRSCDRWRLCRRRSTLLRRDWRSAVEEIEKILCAARGLRSRSSMDGRLRWNIIGKRLRRISIQLFFSFSFVSRSAVSLNKHSLLSYCKRGSVCSGRHRRCCGCKQVDDRRHRGRWSCSNGNRR